MQGSTARQVRVEMGDGYSDTEFLEAAANGSRSCGQRPKPLSLREVGWDTYFPCKVVVCKRALGYSANDASQ